MLWREEEVKAVMKKICEKELEEYLKELDEADIDYDVASFEKMHQLIDYVEDIIREIYCFSHYIEDYISASDWLVTMVALELMDLFYMCGTETGTETLVLITYFSD